MVKRFSGLFEILRESELTTLGLDFEKKIIKEVL